MVKATAETYLVLATIISLILGVLMIVIGATIRSNSASFINMYGEDLPNEVPADACTDPGSGLDFCQWNLDLWNVYLGNSVVVFGSILIIAGASIVILSLLGFCAAACGLHVLLYVIFAMTICVCISTSQIFSWTNISVFMLAVICVAVSLEAYVIDIVTNEEGDFHDTAKEDLLRLLKAEYKLAKSAKDSFTRALNVIMLQAECCGIFGPEDFGGNLTYTRGDGFVYSFLVVPACCRRELLKEKKFTAFSDAYGCTEEPHLHLPTVLITNTQGCYSVVFNHLLKMYGHYAFDILLALIMLHVLKMVLALTILMRRVAVRNTFSQYSFTDARSFALSLTNPDARKSKWWDTLDSLALALAPLKPRSDST